MTYGTSHLFIGGDIFRERVKKNYLLCKGGGHYMKNKNIGVCVLSTQPDQQKSPQCKNAQKMQKKLSNIENFSRSFRSLGILQNSYFWSS